MTRTEAKQIAKARGLNWRQVEAMYRSVRLQQRADREREWAIRRRTWEFYAYSDGSLDFWRHGMQKRFAYAFAEGDRDNIPGFDDVAHILAGEGFSELAAENDPGEALFELLAKPHRTMPTAGETWQDVFDLVGDDSFDDVTFDVATLDDAAF